MRRSLSTGLAEAIAKTLHAAGDPSPIQNTRRVTGGDINEAARVETQRGVYFVKMKFPTRTVNLFLLWILFSLLAIAYIGQRPYLGLGIAIIGGIILGIMSFLYYEPKPPAEERGAEAEGVADVEKGKGKEEKWRGERGE